MGGRFSIDPDKPIMLPEHGIMHGRSADIPNEAIRLTESDVVRIQAKIIRDWKPRWEMHSIINGPGYMGALAAIGGFLHNNYWRKVFCLRNKMVFATFVPTAVIPAILAIQADHSWVLRPMQMRQVVCPTCLELRACVIQLAVGFAQPMVLGALSAAYTAKISRTYAIPPWSQPRVVLQMYMDLGKKLRNPALMLLLLQVVVASALTYEQQRSVNKLINKMAQEL